MEKPCYVYILRCADGTLYTGTAYDVDKRLMLHNAGRGAKYLRGRLPVKEVYRALCPDGQTALRRERRIKALSRQEKEAFIVGSASLHFGRRLTFMDFRDMEALEARCYDRAFITPAAEAYGWYKKHSFTTVAAFQGGALLGFVNLFPVEEAVYRGLLNGTYNDAELTLSAIVDPERTQGPLWLFLCCIAVEEGWRGRGLAARLLARAMEAYEPCRGRIAGVVVDNVTEAGARFCSKLGFVPVTESDHGTRVSAASYENMERGVSSLVQTSSS